MSRSNTCTMRSFVSAAINRNARSVRVQIRIVVNSGGDVFMSPFYNIVKRYARAKATIAYPHRLKPWRLAAGYSLSSVKSTNIMLFAIILMLFALVFHLMSSQLDGLMFLVAVVGVFVGVVGLLWDNRQAATVSEAGRGRRTQRNKTPESGIYSAFRRSSASLSEPAR